jgi:nucleoside-diphosphate-sugar epimerase
VELGKRKCLVIGANSFIGAHLINSLKDELEITGAYHIKKDKLLDSIVNVPVLQLDSLKDVEFAAVYIVSAYIPRGPISSLSRAKMFEANIELVDRVCSLFAKSKIIYCSTVSVYKVKEGVINEAADEGGLNEYGASKLWAEKIVEQQQKFSILRFSSVYGPGMNIDTLIPVYIKQALVKKEIHVWGDGHRCQNYVHVLDVIGFLKKALELEVNGKYLITSPRSISNLELANVISSSTASKILFTGEDLSPSFFYNNDRSVNALGYQSKVSLNEGINEVIKWMQEKF